MDDGARLSIAREAMLEGDLGTARRIVDVVLARTPSHPEALRLATTLREVEAERAGVPPEALGDLRPDTRHLEDPVAFADAMRAPAPPVGVWVLAALNVVSGGIAALTGLVAMLTGAAAGLLLVLLGLLQLAAGVGLWRLRAWAWYLSVIALALGFVLNAIDALRGEAPSFFWGLAQAIALVYLVRVRARFLPPASGRAAPA